MTGRKRFSCDDHKKFGTWPPDIGQHRLHFIHLKPLLFVHAAVCAGMYPIITADKQPQPSEKVESSQRTARWQGQKDALGLDCQRLEIVNVAVNLKWDQMLPQIVQRSLRTRKHTQDQEEKK